MLKFPIVKSLVGYLILEAVSSILANLINDAFDLSECHMKLVTGVFSAIEGVSMMYDAMSYLKFSGIGGLMMAASVPILMYPIITMATIGWDKCDANPLARMASVSSYSVRSASTGGGKGKCDAYYKNILKNWMGSNSQVATYATSFEYNKKIKKYDLSVHEYSAIRFYTANGSVDLNDMLDGKKVFSTEINNTLSKVADMINAGLAKLPNYTGTVVRRVNSIDIDLSTFQVGKTKSFNSFMSTTHNLHADVFPDRDVRLVIESKTAKKIDDISQNSPEQEALFGQPKKFLVEKRKEYPTYTEINLIEVTP